MGRTGVSCPGRSSGRKGTPGVGQPRVGRERVLDELQLLHDTYGVRNLKIADEMFVLNERHVFAICDGIVAKNVPRPGERPHATGETSICLVCKRGKAGPDCVLVPARGPVCLQCVERVQAAAATSTKFSDE